MSRQSGARRALAVLLWAGLASAAPADPEQVVLSDDSRIEVRAGRTIELFLLPSAGDTWESVARRVSGDGSRAARLRSENRGAQISPGRWLRIPLELLTDELRGLVLRSLFPKDRREGEDWIHVARAGVLGTYDEGLWQVAEWFTGEGARFAELLGPNRLSSPELRAGQEVRIPAALLHPAFRRRATSADGVLEYAEDALGPYAVYRLRAGEALYSAVVLRFTGRTTAEDVRELAENIGKRSGIRDVRDIPVGFEVKIPQDYLEPEFLPEGHPRRLAADAERAERESSLAQSPVPDTRGLKGVLVIVDPGHGGRDVGTMNHGIWEHDYVYDVACRLKRILEAESAASVRMTLEDRETGYTPSTGDRLVANYQGTILTSPPFLARAEGDANIGVNLRWYLANSIYRKARTEGTDVDRILFLSLHGDSRHTSLRGLMAYVPGASLRDRTYGYSSEDYHKFQEVREQPRVQYSRKERVRSEAVSRKLAQAIVDAFRSEGLPVQPYQPVRDQIIRGKSRFVPAVLRGNAVPTKVLVEMVNLSNREDAGLLASARMRDRLARGLASALFRHFGEQSMEVARRDLTTPGAAP